jgi:hypothetical protein
MIVSPEIQALIYLLQVIRTDDVDVQIIESFVIMSPEIETEEKESESTPNPIFHFKDKTRVFSSNYQSFVFILQNHPIRKLYLLVVSE